MGLTFLHGNSILFVIIEKPTLVSKDLKRMCSLLYNVLVNIISKAVLYEQADKFFLLVAMQF